MIRNSVAKSPVSNAQISSLPPNQTIISILEFLESWLLIFRNEYVSTMSSALEDDISENLFHFLQAQAKSNNLLFYFNAQKGVDFLIRVSPFVMSAPPIFVIEAKRLPPTNPKDYVQGRTGGVERFKREQDGFALRLNECAMLGYVQKYTFNYWYEQVNHWIGQLIDQGDTQNKIYWGENDKLVELPPKTEYIAKYISTHSRKTQETLTIRHFWLNMQQHISTD